MEINIKHESGTVRKTSQEAQEAGSYKKPPSLKNCVPLTVKIFIMSAVVGMLLWVVLDHVQVSRTKSMLMDQLNERLGRQAMEDRLRFDRYVKTFPQSVRLFVRQKNFSDYVDNQTWHPGDREEVTPYRRPPKWFPRLSVLRIFAQPRYALLLDAQGRVREIYTSHQENPPASLLNPPPIMTAKSRRQSYLIELDRIPYLVTSDALRDSRNKVKAILMLASPIDDGFLLASLGSLDKGHEVALLTSGKDPKIMTSTNLKKIPAGTPLSQLQERYAVTGKEFFDYGASNLVIKLASLISTAQVKTLTESVILRERQGHAISGTVYILSFAVIMLWIVRRIQNLTKRISRFSGQVLGTKQEDLPRGDQLYVLDQRFRRLTEEVHESREIIRRQAEEQTSLIVNNAFDTIITTDAQARIITWNPRAEAVFGWKKEEVAGKRIFEVLVPEQYRKRHLSGLKRFLRTGFSPVFNMQFEATCLHRKGHEFPVELAVSPVKSGDHTLFIAIIRDITERNKAAEKIRGLLDQVTSVKNEWEKTFDSVKALIVLVDRDLKIIRYNNGFSRFARQPDEEITGSACQKFLPCEAEWFSYEDRGDQKEEIVKKEVRTENGLWLYVSHVPAYDETGRFLYTIIVATDITELKNTQQHLIESREEIKDKVEDLEKFYELAVNRELKMIELKKEIRRLKAEHRIDDPVEV